MYWYHFEDLLHRKIVPYFFCGGWILVILLDKLLNLIFLHEFWCFCLDVFFFFLKFQKSNSLSSTWRKVWRQCKAMAAAGAKFFCWPKHLATAGLEQKHIRGNHPHWYIDPGSFGAQSGRKKGGVETLVSPWKINGWNLKWWLGSDDFPFQLGDFDSQGSISKIMVGLIIS